MGGRAGRRGCGPRAGGAAPAPARAGVGGTGLASLGRARDGSACLAGGAVFGGLSTQSWMRRDELQGYRVRIEEIEDEDYLAKQQALTANVLYGVGAAATLTGVVLLLVSGDGDAGAGADVHLAPGGVVVEGAF